LSFQNVLRPHLTLEVKGKVVCEREGMVICVESIRKGGEKRMVSLNIKKLRMSIDGAAAMTHTTDQQRGLFMAPRA